MIDASYGAKKQHYFEDRREEMLPFVPSKARRMLEIGCGNAAFAAHLKTLRTIEVTAIESHPPAAEIARARVDRVLCASIEVALPQLSNERFDCIVLNDVLEHLVDPWEVLVQLRSMLADGGSVLASIPNIRYLPVFKEYVLQGRWQYRQDGVMDRTHLRFFTNQSIHELFESTGYTLTRLEGINSIEVSWKFTLLNILTRGSLDDTLYKQFACLAQVRGERVGK